MFLIFDGGSKLKVEGYTNSDFMFDVDDRKSILRCIFLCNEGSISWKSFQQPVITDLTIEVEYIAASKVAKKVFWFKRFIVELDVVPSDAIVLHCDNNGAIALVKKFRSHQKSKHIERQFHIIHEYLKKKFVKVQRVDSTQDMTNPLIKPLSQQKTEAHFEKMGLKYMVNSL